MAICTLAARQPLTNWKLVTAYPDPVITPPSGGTVGVADVTCIHNRQVMYWFSCYGGFFPVPGTEFGTSDPGPGSTQPVITLQMSLPLQGVLGQVADSLGVSLEIMTWFQNQGAADALCSGNAVSHKADQVVVPECENGKIKLPWHEWSKDVVIPKLPEDTEKVKVSKGNDKDEKCDSSVEKKDSSCC